LNKCKDKNDEIIIDFLKKYRITIVDRVHKRLKNVVYTNVVTDDEILDEFYIQSSYLLKYDHSNISLVSLFLTRAIAATVNVLICNSHKSLLKLPKNFYYYYHGEFFNKFNVQEYKSLYQKPKGFEGDRTTYSDLISDNKNTIEQFENSIDSRRLLKKIYYTVKNHPKLTDQDKIIFYLRAFKGITCDNVCKIFGCSITNVSQKYLKVLKYIRLKIKEKGIKLWKNF